MCIVSSILGTDRNHREALLRLSLLICRLFRASAILGLPFACWTGTVCILQFRVRCAVLYLRRWKPCHNYYIMHLQGPASNERLDSAFKQARYIYITLSIILRSLTPLLVIHPSIYIITITTFLVYYSIAYIYNITPLLGIYIIYMRARNEYSLIPALTNQITRTSGVTSCLFWFNDPIFTKTWTRSNNWH